jgi:hypothetical protein
MIAIKFVRIVLDRCVNKPLIIVNGGPITSIRIE